MKTPRKLCGIDPGSLCGWAVHDGIDVTHAGTWDLRPKRFEGAGMRYVRLEQYLRQLLASGVELVAFEEVHRHAGTAAAHVYGGVIATIERVCEELKIPYVGVPVATAKRAGTGKGNADKQMMMHAAEERWGRGKIGDDNEADARWIAVVAAEQYGA